MEVPPVNLESQKLLAAVRRINDRWLVRGSLRDHANAFISELETSDPDRLLRTCQATMELVRNRVPGEDPKPLFYAGLFAFATPDEIQRYLSEHLFTRTICLLRRGDAELTAHQSLPEATRKLAESVISKLDEVIIRLFEKPDEASA